MAKISLRAYNREIEAMTDRGQLDEAIAHCQHILKTFPKHLETYRLLGKAFLEYKRYKDAVDIFSRVLVVEPNDFVANVGMSIIRDEENKLDDAIWHMERAFEVQSANPAIQGELQRLYGRREGVQPPRIRMTRGALAHMYMQGELYPQAISEVKSVLSDDAGRTDMQVLMARAYLKSGQKNEAADTASAVLRRYPYCLDANRILVEILGGDRPENSQLYRQRVIELDPYAAQVSGSIFDSNEVGDAAITLEHFEWDGKPTGSQPEWDGAKAISLDSGRGASRGPEAQPDWLTNGGFADSTPPPLTGTPKVVPPLPASDSTFDFAASMPAVNEPEPVAQPNADADIPDFLRAAGWGQSTGTFDESKMSFADEPASSASVSDAMPIAQGDMPDWLKAMAPPQVTQAPQSFDQPSATPAEEEELPDWINNIGKTVLPASAAVAASDEFDWLNPAPESSTQPVDDQPDWMKPLDQPASSQPEALDTPDWMKQFDQPASTPAASDQPDWLTGFGSESDATTPTSATLEDQSDWMKQFGEIQAEPAAASSMPAGDEFDFLNELTAPSSQSIPSAPSAADTNELGKSPNEIDDSLDWLENLAAKQGATEGLLIKPEDRKDVEPDWVTKIKNSSQPVAEPIPAPTPAPTPVANVEDLGKSQPDIDESLAWFENLAAKQGATEGLLIKPEDRKDVEPDWIQKIKNSSQPVAQPTSTPEPTPASAPVANVEELGKSESEIDDSLAWLENLAAKQGATEGLLIKPEDRKDAEPDWIQKIKNSSQPVAQPTSTPEPTPASAPVASVEELGKSESEIDDSLAWLENLAAKQGATEGLLIKPEDRKEAEPDWIQKIKNSSQPVAQPTSTPEPTPASTPATNVEDLGKSQSDIDDSLAWFESLAAKQGATEGLLIKPEDRKDVEPDWIQKIKNSSQPAAEPTPASIPEPTPAANVEELGKSQAEIDDSLAWLENLAAKQGATEGLLIKPEDRMEKEPDWVQQVKKSTGELRVQQPETQPSANIEELGKSQSDIDESLAWFESLAAKQGATEGLLIKPEDRKDVEPDWVTKIKNSSQPAAEPTPAPVAEPTPVANVEDLGKSQSDIDESLAWFESLAAKQGATEGLLIKPEDRKDVEPDWVQKIKNSSQPAVEPTPAANVEELGKSQSDIDESLAWFESLAAKQGATEGLLIKPEDRKDVEPDWVKQVKSAPVAEPTPAQPESFEQQPVDDTAAWLRSLDEEDAKAESVSVNDDTTAWLQTLDEPEPVAQAVPADDMPSWLQGIGEEKATVAETAIPAQEAVEDDWMSAIEEPVASLEPDSDGDVPSWLKGIDEESSIVSVALPQDDLPAWMRDETGEVVAEPTKIEPTRATDWHPSDEKRPEPPASVVREEPKPVAPVEEKPKPVKKAAPKPAEPKPTPAPEPYREPVTRLRGTGMLTTPQLVDPILDSARTELTRSNIPGALETYAKLIKKGRFLDEVVFDLREALYRYPVEVSIWQSLGDAYMRANRLQDALDAYTKAEELLR